MSFNFLSFSGISDHLLQKPSEVKWPERCRVWQHQVLGMSTRVHGYPCSGRDERTEGRETMKETLAAYIFPASGQMCSFIGLLGAPELGMKRLKSLQSLNMKHRQRR